jgi:hypothetical protein
LPDLDPRGYLITDQTPGIDITLSLTRPGGFNAMTPWRTVGADVYSDLEADYRFKHALMAERVVANANETRQKLAKDGC